MSRLIAAPAAGILDPAECLALAEASNVDAADETAFESLAPLLASLAANPDFLADAAITVLKRRRERVTPIWGSQALTLATGSRFVLRASLWPGARDAILSDSGPGAFFYGVPHDHDFAFLTCGYAGPGYLSEEWEVDANIPAGTPGECVALRGQGRHRLIAGQIRHYRAYRDVHAQIAPEAFSVSLNLLARAAPHPWRGQLRYDAGGSVVGAISATPTALLLELSIQQGNGLDLAVETGRDHSCRRTRIAAWRALAAASPAALRPLLARPTVAADRILAAYAAAIAAELDGSAD